MEDSAVGEFFKENKKIIIACVIMIILAIIFSIARKAITNKESNGEVKLTPESAAEMIAGLYYEEVLYPYYKEDKDYLDLLAYKADEGFEVTLKDLTNSITDVNYQIFMNDKVVCDYNYSYVTIYPFESYGKEDYRIETHMMCEEPAKKEED